MSSGNSHGKRSAASVDPHSLLGKREQAQAWLDAHLPHLMTEDECVPCQMATNVILLTEWVQKLREALYLYAHPEHYSHGPGSMAPLRYEGDPRPRSFAELDGGLIARLRLHQTGGCEPLMKELRQLREYADGWPDA